IGTEGTQRAPANYLDKSTPQAREYVAQFKAKAGSFPSDWATLGYDCVMAWAQAANAAKSIEADAIMRAIETTQFNSPRGPFRFGVLPPRTRAAPRRRPGPPPRPGRPAAKSRTRAGLRFAVPANLPARATWANRHAGSR